MIRDRALSMMLLTLFGISGTFIIVFSWLNPMPLMEMVLSNLIGVIGLGVALSRIPQLKFPKAGANAEKVPVEVKTGN